jgi:ankyrin repeat protein
MLASIAIGAPIHTAAEKGNLARVRTLLNNGVAVDAKDGQGRTPLYMTASWGRKQVVQLLIDKGVDVNAKNNNGQTPLDSEVDWKHHDIAEIIRKHQALALVPKLAYGGYQQLLIDGAVGQDYDVLYSSDLKE